MAAGLPDLAVSFWPQCRCDQACNTCLGSVGRAVLLLQASLILKILRGKYTAVTGYSSDLVDIVKRCLTQSATRRANTGGLHIRVARPSSRHLILMCTGSATRDGHWACGLQGSCPTMATCSEVHAHACRQAMQIFGAITWLRCSKPIHFSEATCCNAPATIDGHAALYEAGCAPSWGRLSLPGSCRCSWGSRLWGASR